MTAWYRDDANASCIAPLKNSRPQRDRACLAIDVVPTRKEEVLAQASADLLELICTPPRDQDERLVNRSRLMSLGLAHPLAGGSHGGRRLGPRGGRQRKQGDGDEDPDHHGRPLGSVAVLRGTERLRPFETAGELTGIVNQDGKVLGTDPRALSPELERDQRDLIRAATAGDTGVRVGFGHGGAF
jgi:hypothetical protein